MIVSITEDEEPLLLKVAIAEAILGFERRLNPKTGQYQWRGRDPDSGEPTDWIKVECLPSFTTDSEVSWLLTHFAAANELVVQTMFDPVPKEDRLRHIVQLGIRGADGEIEPKGKASAKTFARAASAALVTASGINIAQYHKALFPMRYFEHA